MNVARNLERSAFYFPEQPALAEAGSQISYGELNDRVDRIATGLIKMGIRPGEHVGICAPNSSDWITF
jgi:long-chain acyl-CoA synthetase